MNAENLSQAIKDNTKKNDLPESVSQAVIQDVSRITNINPNRLKIISYSQQTWPNGCLGLPKPGEFCTQALVEGWRVVVANSDKEWIYHTNANGSSLRLANTNFTNDEGASEISDGNTIPPVVISTSELPPPLNKDVVFRQISSGGFAGLSYQTVLLSDGRLIHTRVGDTNDSTRSVRKIPCRQLQQFQQLLKQHEDEFDNLSYPAPISAADYMTYTLTSSKGTVRYNDISQNSLPQNLRTVIQFWNEISR